MKSLIGLALAGGLALMVAGCASSGGGTSAPATGTAAGGAAAGPPPVTVGSASTRNFNLAVKCPGVHYMKSHGKAASDIEQQLAVDNDDIAACEEWVAAQPKGYVPPPPAGVANAAPAPAAPPATKQ